MNILSNIPSDWWKHAVFYQIYPRSFYDSNNDGIGDLKGVTRKLDYLNDGNGGGLGVDAIWLSPFFTSPMKDFGYDVSNYMDIDPIFGTLADFDNLVTEAHARGIKILADLVLNHSSDQHPWFQESKQSRTNQKSDWYIWVDKPKDKPYPNNWVSVFGGSAWEYIEERDQFYYHSFLKEQPDLNWYHPEVQQAIQDIITFWAKRGVDGFRLDTANFYAYDRELKDNPKYPEGRKALEARDGVDYDLYDNCFSKDRPDNFEFLKLIRQAVKNISPHITTIGEIGGIQDMDRLIELAGSYVQGKDALHMVYTFSLLGSAIKKKSISEVIAKTENKINDGWPCWSFGNHDCARVRTRSKKAMGINEFYQNMMLLLLCFRGTPIIYYGDELGMVDYPIKKEELQDPFGISYWPKYPGRDGCRTPFPWQINKKNQGFNDGNKSWLPTKSPVALIEEHGKTNDMFLLTQEMIQIRKKFPALQKGDYEEIYVNDSVYAFRRNYQGQTIFVACNFSDARQVIPMNGNQWEAVLLTFYKRNGGYKNEKITLPPFGFSIFTSR